LSKIALGNFLKIILAAQILGSTIFTNSSGHPGLMTVQNFQPFKIKPAGDTFTSLHFAI
jgi:hypothetical protein